MYQDRKSPVAGVVRAVASLWFGAVLLVLVLLTLACATVYESMHGTEPAAHAFYGTWWFRGLLALLGVNVLAAVLARLPLTRAKIGFVVTHASLLLILLGALATRLFGIDGQLALIEGESTDQLRLSGRERLTIANRDAGALNFVDLDASVFGALEAVDRPNDATVRLDTVSLRVLRYLPDSEASTAVTNDGPAPRSAVEASLLAAGVDDPAWVLEGEPRSFGQMTVVLTSVADRAELEARLSPQAADTVSAGTLKLEIAGAEYQLPIEACMKEPQPVGPAGYTAKVLEYFPHATVASGGGVVNASAQPVNPAIRAEIVGPGGAQTKLAFARFPDFASSHGSLGAEDVKLVFVSSAAAPTPSAPVEVLTTPAGDLYARFTAGGATTNRELRLGGAIDTPWPGVRFAVLRKFDRARVTQQLVVPEKIGSPRTPAVLLAVQGGESDSEVWLTKNAPKQFTIAGVPYEFTYRDQAQPLGFRIALNKFTVGYYPGGRRPRSFESQITITDPATGATVNRIISMNHPTSYGGYTLYQSSYELSGQKALSVLSVARDPGQPIVFVGYFGLLGGMCWVLVTRRGARSRAAIDGNGRDEARRKADRKISLLAPGEHCVINGDDLVAARSGRYTRPVRHRAGPPGGAVNTLALIVTLGLAAGSASAADVPASLDLETVRGLCVQHDGRYMPLDTLARDVVHGVTGRAFFENRDPGLTLLAWTFDAETWKRTPLIAVRNAELRQEIGLSPDKSVFSYAELTSHQRLRSLIQDLSRMEPAHKPDPLESKVSAIHDKLTQLQAVFAGQFIRLAPHPGDALAPWKTPAESKPPGPAWGNLKTAFLAGDPAQFAEASQQLAAAASAMPAAFRPTSETLATELRYNRLALFTTAWRITLVGTLIAALAMAVRRKWFDAVAFLVLLAGFCVLTYGLALRWQIAGRIPASNMFESLLFLGWGVGAFAILAVPLFQQWLVPLTASAMSSLALLLADCLPVDHFIRPIAPVLLDTVWMSIHVPIIMVSYSVLTLAVLVAHIQLVLMAAAPNRTRLSNTVDGLHYWYVQVGVLLLAAGIITGSMWAASSWGRYWGWDPKEVWSLVALLGYLTILHVRIDHERVPVWVRLAAVALVIATLAVIVPKLAPLSAGRVLGMVGAVVGMAFMVMAKGQFATAAKSIICFWLIIMTYVGVNYVLGVGLHSYGFGTGAVARYMFLMGGADMGFVVLCAAIYLIRSRPDLGPASSRVEPAAA